MHDEIVSDLLVIANKTLNPDITNCLLNGRAELALTSQLLHIFNKIVAELNEPLDIILTDTERLQLDQFLAIVSRVPQVSIRQRSVASFEHYVDLGSFKKLKSLTLAHVNLGKVRWLSHLKSQLVSFACRQCVEIEAAFCDRLHWAELVNLTVQCTAIKPSDNSTYFKNSPWLKTLNLSFCKLSSCEFLSNLDHLEHLNLSFNFLSCVPELSGTAKNTLKSLTITNNCLTNLTGLEGMSALRRLDLSNNWLPDKYCLIPLKHLKRLVWIKLENTPVSHIKYYRIYVASCLSSTISLPLMQLDGVCLSKLETDVLGSGLSKENDDLGGEAKCAHLSNVNLPSSLQATSDNDISSLSATRKPPIKKGKVFKPSSFRVPIIADESIAASGAVKLSSSIVEVEKVPMEPSVTLSSSTATKELEATQKTTVHSLCSPQSPKLNENDDTIVLISDTTVFQSQVHPDSTSIPKLVTNEEDPVPAIIYKMVFAEVHATECATPQVESSEDKMLDTIIASFNTADDQCGTDSTESNHSSNETNDPDMDETLTEMNKFVDDDTNSSLSHYKSNKDSEDLSIELTTSDGENSKNNADTSKSGNDSLNSVDTHVSFASCENGDEKLDVQTNIDDSTIGTDDELHRNIHITNNENLENVGSDSSKNSEDSSCSDSDNDADELLWHVMRMDSSKNIAKPIFLALLDDELKERCPKSGKTLAKWSLCAIVSCVKTKNDPITIEMEFDSVKKDRQHRAYNMEFADAQALTKKVYNVLESRPLVAMNQTPMKCLKCSSVSVQERKSSSKPGAGNPPICFACGSADLVEVEEPKLPQNKDSSHSPSQSSIAVVRGAETPGSPEASSTPKDSYSALSVTRSHNSDASNRVRENESDIEVITDPSQSSIEVIDESSRSRSITPTQILSGELSSTLKLEENVKGILTRLSVLTESSSSGSLTESVVTTYESQSVINNKLKGSNEDTSHNSTSTTDIMKDLPKEENGNLSAPKCANDVYSFADYVDVDLRVKTFIYQNVFDNDNEELLALVRCHVWKTGGSDYDGCFVLSTSRAYFLYHNTTDFSDQICDWLSLNESFGTADINRVQPIAWFQGIEIQIKNFSFILLLMDQDRTQSLIKHLSGLSLKSVKILQKPNAIVETSLQQAILTNELFDHPDDPTVTLMVLCRSMEITKVDVSEEILRLAGFVITWGMFLVIPGDLSWLSAGSQPTIASYRDFSSLIEVKTKGTILILRFLDEAEAVEELWTIKLGAEAQLVAILDAIRRPWERKFSDPLEVLQL